MPLIISSTDINDQLFTLGGLAISRTLDSGLKKLSFDLDPNKIISDLETEKELALLIGDAGTMHKSGTSWIEALGAWRHPLILLASPSLSGEIPGSASAYICLCKSLSIPIVGIFQLGGQWDQKKRKLDGLPWCGMIPNEVLNKDFLWDDVSYEGRFFLSDTRTILKKRIYKLGLQPYFKKLF